jgi:hypothetical protein
MRKSGSTICGRSIIGGLERMRSTIKRRIWRRNTIRAVGGVYGYSYEYGEICR